MTDQQKNLEQRGCEVLERVERERGFERLWPRLMAKRDPDYVEHLHDVVSHVLMRRDALPRKFKEIILMCLNAQERYEFGFRVHARSALKYGANEEEIFEALQAVGIAHLHGMTSMIPAMEDEFEQYRKMRGN